jgi:hypothetical protein
LLIAIGIPWRSVIVVRDIVSRLLMLDDAADMNHILGRDGSIPSIRHPIALAFDDARAHMRAKRSFTGLWRSPLCTEPGHTSKIALSHDNPTPFSRSEGIETCATIWWMDSTLSILAPSQVGSGRRGRRPVSLPIPSLHSIRIAIHQTAKGLYA